MNLDLIQTTANVAAAIGVLLAAWELWQTQKQAVTDFEDEFPREYRELTKELPVKALLGEKLEGYEAEKALPAFFRYVDLCNEQVFLRQNERVSLATWRSWCGGMKSNLKLPAFRAAWDQIKNKTDCFAELERLEGSGFEDDPASWGSAHLERKRPEAAQDLRAA